MVRQTLHRISSSVASARVVGVWRWRCERLTSTPNAKGESVRRDPDPLTAPPRPSAQGVLTSAQLRRWREIAGEPIRGPLCAFPMPFGAPRDRIRPPG
jgi:hypothetical protein